MVKPQQPELRRSDRGATSDDGTKERLTAPSNPAVDGIGGRVSEANLPGHHPEQDQDKPTGKDFVAKMHALAQEDDYEAPSPENEVLDLTQIETDNVHDGKKPEEHGQRGEQLAKVAGKPFEVAGKAFQALRNRLPKD